MSELDTLAEGLWEEMYVLLERPFSEVVEGLNKRWIKVTPEEIKRYLEKHPVMSVTERGTLRVNVGENYFHLTDVKNLESILSNGLEPRIPRNPLPDSRKTVFLSYDPNFCALEGDSAQLRSVLLEISRDLVNTIWVDDHGIAVGKELGIWGPQLGVYDTVPPAAIVALYVEESVPWTSQTQTIAKAHGKDAYAVKSSRTFPLRPGLWNRAIVEVRLNRINMTEQGYMSFEVYSRLYHQSDGFDIGFVSNGSAGRTWGRGAAGILIVSPNLQEVLLLKRSSYVEDPHLWGIPGGARKETANGLEDAIIAAAAESSEEMGSLPRGKIRKQPYVYKKPGTNFTYETFILEIDPADRESFVPHLNWENTDYRWVRRDSLKGILLHSGVKEVLDKYQFEPKATSKN